MARPKGKILKRKAQEKKTAHIKELEKPLPNLKAEKERNKKLIEELSKSKNKKINEIVNNIEGTIMRNKENAEIIQKLNKQLEQLLKKM